MKHQFHKNSTHTYFEIADADWGMYDTMRFNKISDARKRFKELKKENAGNDFWSKRKNVILKRTVITEVVSEAL